MKRRAILVFILGLILTACQSQSVSTSFPPVSLEDQASASPTPPVEAGPQSLAGKAREDLAQRLGVAIDTIEVTTIIGQEFSTETFHCRASKERVAKEEPSPAISGYSVLLTVSERRYEYHVSHQEVIFCRVIQ